MAWTSSIETSYTCPVVKATIGIIQITPDVLRSIAGATIDEKDEWLIVLMGRNLSQNGLITLVDDFYVPQRQERFSGHCDIDEEKYPFPAEVKQKMLGYLHSHHSMQPDFSGVDTGPLGFNQRGQISIVTSKNLPFQEGPMRKFATMTGFSYSAVVRHKLSCGAWGKSKAEIVPAGMRNWPLRSTPTIAPPAGHTKHLGDCQRYSEAEGSTDFEVLRLGNCGWQEEELTTRRLIFGTDGEDIISYLPDAKMYQASHLPHPGGTWQKSQGGVYRYSDSENSDDDEPTWKEAAWREYLENKYGQDQVDQALVRITD